MCIVLVQGQGTFLPAKAVISQATNPAALLGVGGRSSFKEILKKDNVTKWVQTVKDIPIYGSVFTTHNNELGKYIYILFALIKNSVSIFIYDLL